MADGLQALRFVRQLADSPPLEGERDPAAASPSKQMEEEDRKRVLAEAIESLPAQERIAVVLYYNEELRLKEISQVMGLSESRVSRVLSAALLSLQGRLKASGLEV